MKVTLLRHAISIFNETQASGRDCALSDAGREQAKQLEGKFDMIICSEMKRCLETMYESRLVAKNVVKTFDCREWMKDICDYIIGENENIQETEEELIVRVNNFKKYLFTLEKEGSILVISHGDFIQHLTGSQTSLKNAEMIEFDLVTSQIIVKSTEVPVVPIEAVPEEAPVVPTEAVPEEAPVVPTEAVPEEATVVPTEAVPEEAPVPTE